MKVDVTGFRCVKPVMKKQHVLPCQKGDAVSLVLLCQV